MIFYSIHERKEDHKGVIIHQITKDGVEKDLSFAQIAAGLHWPEKGSPGLCVVLGEVFNRRLGPDRKPVRGPLMLIAESEHQEALQTIFSKISDEIGLIGCSDIFCDDTSTGLREFAQAFRDFAYQNEQAKGSLRTAPFADAFAVGFHEVRHMLDKGILEAPPANSICYKQLKKLNIEHLKNPEVHQEFYAIDALRLAAAGMMSHTPKCYRKKSRRRRRSAMAL